MKRGHFLQRIKILRARLRLLLPRNSVAVKLKMSLDKTRWAATGSKPNRHSGEKERSEFIQKIVSYQEREDFHEGSR